MINLASALQGLGAVGRAGVLALFNAAARDTQCQETIARNMVHEEGQDTWSGLSVAERALWLRRAQAAVYGMRDYLKQQ